MMIQHQKIEAMSFGDAVSAMAGKIDTLLSAAGNTDTAGLIRLKLPVTDQTPLDWLAGQSGMPKIYWAERDGSFEMAAVGIADTVDTADEQSLRRILNKLESRLAVADDDARYYGGIRFNSDSPPDDDWRPFALARFVLPRFELVRTPQSIVLAAHLIVDEDRPNKHKILSELQSLCPASESQQTSPPNVSVRADIPDRAGWSRAVDSAYEAFDENRFEKIVLARKTVLTLDKAIDPLLILYKLHSAASGCFSFCFQFDPDRVFLGATPERLYCRSGNRVKCEAIAGTRPRGNTPKDDKKLGQELLSSAKDRREQQLVVESLNEGLNPLCDEETGCARPVELLKLARVQHLISRFDVTLKAGVSDSALLAALHPTAAVGGRPRIGVTEEIHRLEPFDRGWYAGPVGWIGKNRAEFAVGIRSALVSQTSINLYAGAGILDGSQADLEWNELESKISVMMEAVAG